MSRLSNARTELENYEKTRPADYVSQYQPKIKDVMGQLDGMKEFDYDPDADTATSSTRASTPARPSWRTRMHRPMPPPRPAVMAAATAPRRARTPTRPP